MLVKIVLGLSEDMYSDGYTDIVNIDFSEVVIEQMKERCSHTTMKWEVMDVLDLKYNSNEFDAIIDKGTMDALMCEKGDVWDPSPQLISVVTREIDGVERFHLF
ncbi:Endothelin-converting enzyme 2 [Smittium culicis]|uniref:Endothelin-converting enzyme 2 n=1 Tax=Smittium culicis TaxID=133412 RepID=A0A1R1Y1H5_9FUNG|nr:Endothelin-converting enzyme 2 [Smittium culicis]